MTFNMFYLLTAITLDSKQICKVLARVFNKSTKFGIINIDLKSTSN